MLTRLVVIDLLVQAESSIVHLINIVGIFYVVTNLPVYHPGRFE